MEKVHTQGHLKPPTWLAVPGGAGSAVVLRLGEMAVGEGATGTAGPCKDP